MSRGAKAAINMRSRTITPPTSVVGFRRLSRAISPRRRVRVARARNRPAAGRLRALATRTRRLGEIARESLRNPTTLVGGVIVLLLMLMAAFAPLLIEPNQPNAYQMPRDFSAVNVAPGTDGHVLGTTPTGGDVLYGIVWGSRTSLRLSLIVVAITVVMGVAVG